MTHSNISSIGNIVINFPTTQAYEHACNYLTMVGSTFEEYPDLMAVEVYEGRTLQQWSVLLDIMDKYISDKLAEN